MIPAHQLLFMIGLMCFPSISFGDALQKVNDAVNCLNQQSNKNEELRISNTAGPVARVLKRDDFGNVCTAKGYFCIVSTELSWMFTWYIVMTASEGLVSAFDLMPATAPSDILYTTAHKPQHFPDHLVQVLSDCDVQWVSDVSAYGSK